MGRDRARQYAKASLIVLATALVPPAVHAGQPTQETPPTTTAGQPPVDPQGQTGVDLLWRTDGSDGPDRARLFSVVGLNLGGDQSGGLTLAGRGRFFAPFGARSALQIEGSYDWYHDSREGQVDIALINRVRHVQFGLFSSLRYVNLEEFESGRSLSQVGATLDYVFTSGRVGVYGTAALRDTASLGRARNVSVGPNVFDASYLRRVDQFGASWMVDVSSRLQVEGHLAILNPVEVKDRTTPVEMGRLETAETGRTTAGSVRLVYPIAAGWAVTAEGAWNASRVDSQGQRRFVAGVRMGEWPSARSRVLTSRPTPIEIPAIRYQLLTRRVRDGNAAPIADAGPDQDHDPKCEKDQKDCHVLVTLSSSGSVDPDRDSLTKRWTKRSGFGEGETLGPDTGETVTFKALAGRMYVVRLQVTDPFGATSFDEVTIKIWEQGH